MEHYAIIAGGGLGVRMSETVPKQFLPLERMPIIMHSMQRFVPFCKKIIVVLPEDYFKLWADLQKKHHFTIPHTLVAGGETRFDSVGNAMEHLPDEGLVAIHDAVRPFASKMLIARCFYKANKYGNAVAAVRVTDSLRMMEMGKSENVDREIFYRVQTPQVFRCSQIKEAYKQNYRSIFTDDATVLETYGELIHLVEGEELNIKITTPIDMFLAETLIKYKR